MKDVPVGIGVVAFTGWPHAHQPGQIIYNQSRIRNWRVTASPSLGARGSWDPKVAVDNIRELWEMFPEVNFLIGLHEDVEDFRDVTRWHNYCFKVINELGAQDYCFDAETLNPRFAPGGSWQAFVDIIEPVMQMVKSVGGRCWGPGNTGERELGDLANILRTLRERGIPFDVATVHSYPEKGRDSWDNYARLLRQQEQVLRDNGYDYGCVTEFGVTGQPSGFWDALTDWLRGKRNDQRVFDARMKRRYHDLLSRVRPGEAGSFWRTGYLYQITEGTDIEADDSNWGLTTPRGMETGTFRAKSVLSLFG